MVRIYFEKEDSEEKDTKKYVDISIWSLVKANILSSLLLYALIMGGGIALIIIGALVGGS